MGVGLEAVFHFFFHAERFDGLGTGDALVKVGGDLGVDLTDLPVHPDQLLLEDGKQHHQQRHDGQNHQRKAGVHIQHHSHRANQVADAPNAVDQRPGHQGADAGGVAHQPGVDVTYAVLVEIGEGEFLQVGKGGVPHITADLHLDDRSQGAGDVVDHSRQAIGEKIGGGEHPNGVQGLLHHKMVQCVPLEQRQQDVRTAADQAEDHHHQQLLSKGSQEGEDLADAEEAEVLLFVHCCTSWLPDCVS